MARGQGGTLSGFTPLSTPNAPTGLSVSTSIGSATVSFEPPADTGDGAITSFIVTAIDESTGESTGATGSASPITVSPPAGGTFKVRAQAVNNFGPGRLTEFDTGNVVFSGVELYAWGNGVNGQLGDGTTVSKSSPVQIGALITWGQVSAGGDNGTMSAVKLDGTLWAWGRNNNGNLGQNDTVNRSSPVQVGALTNWYEVSVGKDTVAATKSDGTLWAWGYNNGGQVGDNTTIRRSSPVQVGALTDWAQVSVGSNHCSAIKTNGTLWGWGAGSFGKIGDGTTTNRSSPVQVGSLTNWLQVSAGGNHTSAVKTDNTLWAWGLNNSGQLGQNNVVNTSSPVQIGALTNWSQVSAGGNDGGAVKTDGTLWGWGGNTDGTVGDGTTVLRSSPVQIGALTDWNQVSKGESKISAAVKTNGTLWTWGSGDGGALGTGTLNIPASSPVQVGALTDWLKVSAGANAMAALLGVV
jgi:alpha-tubulin suppressor-like RCC1 family protein